MGMSTDEPENPEVPPAPQEPSSSEEKPIGRHSRIQDVFHGSRPGSSFRKRRLLPTGRGLIAVVLVALVVVGLFVDSNYPFHAKVAPQGHVIGAAPTAATSSAWYCPMLYGRHADPGASAVVVLNPNDTTLSGMATFFPQGKPSVDVPVNVAAHARLVLRAGEVVDADYTAALLRFDGGGAAVEHFNATANGIALAPCATQASAQWYFADGSTQSNTSLQIGLFNPFLEDAIADVSFVTNDGNVAPDEFQGVVIPARSFTSINVGDRVRRRDWISTSVSVRSGRIVTSELQTGNINGVPGTGLTLGAASPQATWYLPDGTNSPGNADQITLFNPNDRESEATVELQTDKGSINPFQLHIPPNSRVAVNMNKEDRVPKDALYGTVVKVTNGVNVVVQRTATIAAPAPIQGGFFQMADTDLSKRWIVPFNTTGDPNDDWVYVMNPSGSTADVTVTGVKPGSGAPLVSKGTIQPGRRLLIHVDEFAPDDSNPGLVIESTQPVVAGRTLAINPGQGLNSSLVIPVR
jgi:hypothetical protein